LKYFVHPCEKFGFGIQCVKQSKSRRKDITGPRRNETRDLGDMFHIN